MNETATVSSLFEMPDEDAMVIMARVTELLRKHKMVPDVVKELTATYGEEAVFAGMVMQKTIDRNDRAAQLSEASEGFGAGTFLFGEALGISAEEATEVCEEVGNLALKNPKWKAVFAAVGRQFGERAVFAGAFLLYLYTQAEGEPAKKYDYGRG